MNILITNLGSSVAFGIIKSIKNEVPNLKIYGVDINENNSNVKFVDYFYKCPRYNDKHYLSFITHLIREKKIDVLWPINTLELELISDKKDFLEKELGVKVIINENKILNIVNNKQNLYSYLSEKMPKIIPKYKAVFSYNELMDAIYYLGYPNKKVCMKRCIGSGSKGFRIIDSSVNVGEQIINTQGNLTVTNIEEIKLLSRLPKNKFPSMIVSEYIPYEEYDIDVLSKNGEVKYCIPRLNIHMWQGTSIVTKSLYNKELIDLSSKIATDLSLNFINSITFKYGANKKPYLIEINPRVPATIISTKNSGVNYCKLVLDMIRDGYIKNYKINYGITTVRYWEDYFM